MRRHRFTCVRRRFIERLEDRSVLTAVPLVALPVMDPSELLSPGSTHAVDLDGDSDQDLVVAGASGLVWSANDGDGQFSGVQNIHREDWSVAQLQSGDLDGDQRMDLVAIVTTRQNPYPSQLIWIRNLGEGQFAAPATLLTQPLIRALLVADLDGDQRAEITISSEDSSDFSMRRVDYETTAFSIQSVPQVTNLPVAFSDLDADGDNDLLAQTFGQVVWYENTDGRWTQPTRHLVLEKTEPNIYTSNLADLDRDGDADVVVVTGDGITVLSNQRGTFTSTTTIQAGQSFSGLVLADADRDGDIDIQSYASDVRQLLWYLNEGQGSRFSDGKLDGDGRTNVVQTADLTGDGHVELIRSRGEWSRMTDNLTSQSSYVPYYAGTASIEVGDMNGDGRQDIVTISSQGLEIRLNRGGYRWSDPQRLEHSATFGSSNVADILRLADIDGDGDLDVVTVARMGNAASDLVWVSNDGAGRLANVQVIQPAVGAAIDFMGLNGNSLLHIVDFDRDGDLDILTGDGQKIYFTENVDRQGTLSTRVLSEGLSFSSLALADIDGDGDLDIVAGRSMYSLPLWFENQGQNTIVRREEFSDVGPLSVQAIDLNGDGTWELGGGEGSDMPPFFRFRSPSLPGPFLSAGDLDRDGDLDLVLNTRLMSLNNGQWWDQESNLTGVARPLPVSTQQTKLIDLEGDGDLDLVGIGADRGIQLIRNDLFSADIVADGKIDAQDLDLICRSDGTNRAFDFNHDELVDAGDMLFVVHSFLGTTRGDANLDGVFNSRDLIDIFQQGLYETQGSAGWSSGDWTCDGRFDSADLVGAFADGAYERSEGAAVSATSLTDMAWAASALDHPSRKLAARR